MRYTHKSCTTHTKVMPAGQVGFKVVPGKDIVHGNGHDFLAGYTN
jgi:hypothetical protein